MATKKKTEMAVTGATELSVDIELDNSPTGLEGADQESFAIPFLRVLQKMSPEVDEADGAYVEGAKPGMLYNTVTQELYDGKQGVIILPCKYERKFMQWAPRDSDGGLRDVVSPEEFAKRVGDGLYKQEADGNRYFVPLEDGSINDKKCDRVSDTRNHYCLMIDLETGMIEQVLLTLTSTQIKKSKALNSMLTSAKVLQKGTLKTPPSWLNRIRVTSVAESNDQGTWHGVKFSRDEEKFITDPAIAAMGRDFYELVTQGAAKVDYSQAEAETKKGEGF